MLIGRSNRSSCEHFHHFGPRSHCFFVSEIKLVYPFLYLQMKILCIVSLHLILSSFFSSGVGHFPSLPLHYTKDVLVPVSQEQYKELVDLIGVPFRSIVGEMGVYWVEKHIQEGKQVHWGRKKSFGWMFFKVMLKHWHGQRSPVEYVKAKKLMQKDVYLQWLSKSI